MSAPLASAPPHLRRRHPWRDTIEGLLSALALVLIIRHFAFEVFKIPTGSMAPTLLGQHRDVVCPNCGYGYIVDGGGNGISPQGARCPNCWYRLDAVELARLRCSCFPAWPPRLFWRGGNRVIVNKFLSHMRSPERWDIIVFKYPFTLVHCLRRGDRLDEVPQGEPLPKKCPVCDGPVRYERQNFIKRLVGLPGEKLTIRHGDIYVNGKLQRKPPQTQEAVWQHVYDSRWFPAKQVHGDVWSNVRGGNPGPEGSPGELTRWKAEAGSFTEEGGRLKLTGGKDGARVRYVSPIVDYAAYNQWPPGDSLNPVGDMRWTVDVTLDAPGLLQLGIEEDGRQFTAVVRFGQGDGSTVLLDGESELCRRDFAAKPGRSVRISFANADDRLELRADGRLILSHDMNVALEDVQDADRSSGAWLATSGEEADFARVRLQRDLYYIIPPGAMPPPDATYDVSPGGYFAMGDNTRNSKDSRYWDSVPQENLLGVGSVVWWPLNQVRPCR